MNIKKWYFVINEGALNSYKDMIKVAVYTAVNVAKLKPYCIYYGNEIPFLNWLRSNGVAVIHHASSIIDSIKSSENTNLWNKDIAQGAYLRLDIPILEFEDDYVLYTDCDVIFTSEIKNFGTPPKLFSAAPEFEKDNWNYCNTGVMVLNVKALRESHDEFADFCSKNLTKLPEIAPGGVYDQAAFNYFYKGRWDKLPLELNWKPYWGINEDAKIVHFHGPKPKHIDLIKGDFLDNIPKIYINLFNRSVDGAKYYLNKFKQSEKYILEEGVFGRIDSVVGNFFRGWAYYADDLANPVEFDVFQGSNFIFTVSCDMFRQDLKDVKKSMIGAFEFSLPEECVGKNIYFKCKSGRPMNFIFKGQSINEIYIK